MNTTESANMNIFKMIDDLILLLVTRCCYHEHESLEQIVRFERAAGRFDVTLSYYYTLPPFLHISVDVKSCVRLAF